MKPKMRRYEPREADWYLRRPELLARSSNLALVTPGSSRDARTRGADGTRYVDLFRSTSRKALEAELRRVLSGDIETFRAAVDDLKLVEINGSDSGYDPVLAECCPGLEVPERRKAREVCIATPWTDTLMRPFAEALEVTARLSDSARAYRRGHRNAVYEILVEIQGLINRGGPWFWAVVDIKDFFASMSRDWLRKAMKAQGYTRGFIQRVMALVEAPMVDAQGRPVERSKGCPPGLRISGVLANIYCAALDEMIATKFGVRVVYIRYSDDILILSQKRHEVIGGVRAITSWLSVRGHKVKGQGPGFSPEYLVHDLRKQPLDVLGARILSSGEIVMIPEKAEAVRRRIHRMALIASAMGPVVIGLSQYATWAGPTEDLGRSGSDWSDVTEALDQIEDYWGALNKHLTEEFVSGLRATLRSEGPSGPQQWVTVIPSGRGDSHVSDGGIHRFRPDSATRSLGIPVDLHSNRPGPCAQDLEEEGSEVASLYGDGTEVPLCGDRDEDLGVGRQSIRRGQSPIHGDGEHQDRRCHRHDDEALDGSRWSQPQDTVSREEGQMSSNLMGSNAWFAEAWGGADTSRPPIATPHVDVSITVSAAGIHNGRPWALVTTQGASGTSTHRYSLPAQSALVEAVRVALRHAQHDGRARLSIRTEPWLPKHLVRRGARFHGVALFDRVETLHDQVRRGSTDLFLVGRPAAPASVPSEKIQSPA